MSNRTVTICFYFYYCTQVIQTDGKTVLSTVTVPDDATVSSVAFGMPNLDSLFVTADSYRGQKTEGAMFKVDGTGSTGSKVEFFDFV